MKCDKFSRSVFWLATVAMFLCGLFVLGLMAIARAYSMVPSPLWPGAVFLPFIALAYGTVEALDSREERERINQTFLLWGNPLGWMLLLAIWGFKKSPSMCLIALIAFPGLKEDD